MRQAASLVRVAVVLGILAAPAGATMILRSMSLPEVAGEATRIVHGTVTDVRSGRDESDAPATWITIDVARTLKGSVGRRLTIKQFGVAEPLADGTVTRIPGLPAYQVGEEVVVFLRDDSERGFTSPVGLGQGVYRVSTRGGRRTVQSDLRGGHQDLDSFLSGVAGLAATGR
jgi:hypothetical protein